VPKTSPFERGGAAAALVLMLGLAGSLWTFQLMHLVVQGSAAAYHLLDHDDAKRLRTNRSLGSLVTSGVSTLGVDAGIGANHLPLPPRLDHGATGGPRGYTAGAICALEGALRERGWERRKALCN